MALKSTAGLSAGATENPLLAGVWLGTERSSNSGGRLKRNAGKHAECGALRYWGRGLLLPDTMSTGGD
jgi:hypothetical protein